MKHKATTYQERRATRMDRVDRMPADLRACVHDFGLTVVDAFLAHGIIKPRIIRHLVKTVREGSVEIGDPGAGRARVDMIKREQVKESLAALKRILDR